MDPRCQFEGQILADLPLRDPRSVSSVDNWLAEFVTGIIDENIWCIFIHSKMEHKFADGHRD